MKLYIFCVVAYFASESEELTTNLTIGKKMKS